MLFSPRHDRYFFLSSCLLSFHSCYFFGMITTNSSDLRVECQLNESPSLEKYSHVVRCGLNGKFSNFLNNITKLMRSFQLDRENTTYKATKVLLRWKIPLGSSSRSLIFHGDHIIFSTLSCLPPPWSSLVEFIRLASNSNILWFFRSLTDNFINILFLSRSLASNQKSVRPSKSTKLKNTRMYMWTHSVLRPCFF